MYMPGISKLVELKRNPNHNYLNKLLEIYFK